MISHKVSFYRKCGAALVFFVIVCGSLSGIAYEKPVRSSDLINNAKQYDGTIIQYEGEVIGDIMNRGNNAWMNVNDGQNAIGIWVDRSLVEDVTRTGGYNSTGDTVEISGVFHRACIEHGGDLDIHAQSVRKISSGAPISHSVDAAKVRVAVALSVVVLLLWFISSLRPR